MRSISRGNSPVLWQRVGGKENEHEGFYEKEAQRGITLVGCVHASVYGDMAEDESVVVWRKHKG